MKLRIKANNDLFGTQVFNAETGEAIENVESVSFEHKAGHMPVIVVKVFDWDGKHALEADGVIEIEYPNDDEVCPSRVDSQPV